jgi:2-polyprenyl-6-hydroxyphenyl methylase/3-demethylubiquinone-9 3-methyltransferase
MPKTVSDYYAQKLAAGRLQQVYAIASPRVRQYLEAEIDFVRQHIRPGDRVLELGCGYGRVLTGLLGGPGRMFGIDTALASLALARRLPGGSTLTLAAMNAVQTGFKDDVFDLTVCIQNGISAFNVDPVQLMRASLRITRDGGKVLFSSYAAEFWNERLEWFRQQAREGLLGEIDEQATGNGVIVCRDGFKATTFGPEDFKSCAARLGYRPRITTVNHSSVFCELLVNKTGGDGR